MAAAQAKATRDNTSENPHPTISLGTNTATAPPSGLAYYLTVIGRLWQAGIPISWPQFYSQQKRYRLPLPGYAFEPTHFPVDTLFGNKQPANQPRKPLNHWYYLPQWQRRPRHNPPATTTQTWLLIEQGQAWQKALQETLQQQGQTVVSVQVGPAWQQESAFAYTLRPDNKADWQQLLTHLKADNLYPHMVLHTLNIEIVNGRLPHTAPTTIQHRLEEGYLSFLWLAQLLGEATEQAVCLTILTCDLMDIIGTEAIDVAAAPILGPAKIVPYEYDNLRCCLIDLHLADIIASSSVTQHIVTEAQRFYHDEAQTRQLALRHGHYWQQTYHPISLTETKPATTFLKAGVYLITGGLGGIGFTLANHLGHTYNAKVALVSRTPLEALPDSHTYQAAIQQLKEAGAEVMTFAADVADLPAMSQVMNTIKAAWGPINGVFHCAGVAEGQLLHTRQPATIWPTLAPKVQGTLVLHRLLKTEPVDFILLFSSLGNVLHSTKVGQIAYNSGNEFLDAFAAYCAATGGPTTISLNFDDWQQVGMSVRANETWQTMLTQLKDEALRTFIQQLIAAPTITPDEGLTIIQHVLAAPYPRIIATPFDLNTQITEATSHRALLQDIYRQGSETAIDHPSAPPHQKQRFATCSKTFGKSNYRLPSMVKI